MSKTCTEEFLISYSIFQTWPSIKITRIRKEKSEAKNIPTQMPVNKSRMLEKHSATEKTKPVAFFRDVMMRRIS